MQHESFIIITATKTTNRVYGWWFFYALSKLPASYQQIKYMLILAAVEDFSVAAFFIPIFAVAGVKMPAAGDATPGNKA